jgi:menaquinone-specific isochorismate synthase
MPEVLIHSIDSKSLLDWIVQAIAQAQITQTPILLSYTENWDCVNPLLLLASKSEPQQPKFYWEQPIANLVIAGAGSVAEVSLPKNAKYDLGDRFDCAKKFIKTHLTNAIIAEVADLDRSISPTSIHIFGAFSFYRHDFSRNDHDDLNNNLNKNLNNISVEFPTLLFFIPRWMVCQKYQGSTLTLNYYIQPCDKADQVLENIEDLRSHLLKSSNYEAPTVHEVNKIIEVQGAQIWTDIVEHALALIHQGHLEKVVLARALDVLADRDFDPFQVLHVLRCEYPECISFLLDCGIGKTFLGATPEIVLQFKALGDRLWIRSDALAGSIERGKTVQEDQMLGEKLLNSEKDMREHQIVIRSICDRLQSMGAEIDPQVSPNLLRLSNVQHLHTPITAHINHMDWLVALDILQQLHPTAAVGGEPRDLAVGFMQQWEACDRGWYAAPIGWLNGNGEGTFGVGIRAGYIEGDRARIFAGAGIVANSQVKNEQSETTIKFAALLKALGAM